MQELAQRDALGDFQANKVLPVQEQIDLIKRQIKDMGKQIDVLADEVSLLTGTKADGFKIDKVGVYRKQNGSLVLVFNVPPNLAGKISGLDVSMGAYVWFSQNGEHELKDMDHNIVEYLGANFTFGETI